MKLKQSRLSVPNIGIEDSERVQNEQVALTNQLEQIRSHLNELKQQLYSSLDAGLTNAKDFGLLPRDWLTYFNGLLEKEGKTPSIDKAEFESFKNEKKDQLANEEKAFKAKGIEFSDYEKLAFLVSKVPGIGGYGPLQLYANMHIETQFNIFNDKPSEFLEKAYTLQTFDANAKPQENRHQIYISAGTAFSANIDGNRHVTPTQLMCNDAGALIGSINSSISQINRAEALIRTNQFESAAAVMPALTGCLRATVETAQGSKIIDVTPEATSMRERLSQMIQKFVGFCSNIGLNQQERSRRNFNSFFQCYKDAVRSPEDPEAQHGHDSLRAP